MALFYVYVNSVDPSVLPWSYQFLPDTTGFLVPTFFQINHRKGIIILTCGMTQMFADFKFCLCLAFRHLTTNANRLNGDISVDDLDSVLTLKLQLQQILILVNNSRECHTLQIRSSYRFGSSGILTLNVGHLKEVILMFLFPHSACQVRKLASLIM